MLNDYGMPAILDENGAVLHADFTKTGLPTHIQPPSDVTAGTPYRSRFGNPYLFNGRRWDGELGLYYYRNRHLDPIQGRFTTRDPIGNWGDGMNLGNGYGYVGNNPWTYVDPLGLETYPSGLLGWAGYYSYEVGAGALTVPRLMLEGIGAGAGYVASGIFGGGTIEGSDRTNLDAFEARVTAGNSQLAPNLQGELANSVQNTANRLRYLAEISAVGISGPLGTAFEVGSAGFDFSQGNYGAAAIPVALGSLRACPTVRRLGNIGEDSRNIVYRAITPEDAARIANGQGLLAKAPDGTWTAAQHVTNYVRGSTGGAAANGPWISTIRNLDVARGYDSGAGIVAIDLDKVDSIQVEVWRTSPRVNGPDGRAYHRSIWAEEVTIYQSIPPSAIIGGVPR